jgi:hypothetical protein
LPASQCGFNRIDEDAILDTFSEGAPNAAYLAAHQSRFCARFLGVRV